MAFDVMRERLTTLARKLQEDDIKLIIGGGYGLILKHEYLQRNEFITRFAEIPEDRSTNDIDIFLKLEIITDAEKMEKIKTVLKELEYEPVAHYFQFVIDKDSPERKVKIDLLAPPVGKNEKALVEIKKPRIRAKKASKIHGYLTEEAVTVEEELIPFNIGEADDSIEIFLPHPFTYLILKLFAVRDRNDLYEEKHKEEDLSKAKYHAFDIYRIIAMMTEEEWKQAENLREKYVESSIVSEARQIANEYFSSLGAKGFFRLKQHIRDKEIMIEDENISAMIADLKELFPSKE